jgi:hypothetical protein
MHVKLDLESIFGKNISAFEIYSNREKTEFRIEIKINVIGNEENELFLYFCIWLKQNRYQIFHICIVLPGEFEPTTHFTTIVHYFHKELKCDVTILYGKKNDELKKVLSALANDGSIKQWIKFKQIRKERIIPEQKTPQIDFNKKSFNDYFTKTLTKDKNNEYLKQMYENIFYQDDKKETKYYKYIEQHFINKLLEKQIFYALLLVCLLNKDFVRNSFLEIYKKKKNSKATKKDTTDNILIANENEDIFGEYLKFLQGQLYIANEIYAGIYELAKNIIEHSELQEGRIIIRAITNDDLLKENKVNQHLWKNYFGFITQELGKKHLTFLDISIADVGTKGIIETSLKNMRDKTWRENIDTDIRNHDIEIIEKEIRNYNDESKLLFDMYFEGSNPLKLDRQANNSYKGLGIYLFTEFINQNRGLFNVQTNEWGSSKGTIDFSYYNKSIGERIVNKESYGTKYKIILPIIVKNPDSNEIESERPRLKEPLAKVVYEKMLLLKGESGEHIALPELKPYNLQKHIIEEKYSINTPNKIFVFSLQSQENNDLPKIDRSMVFRNMYYLFKENPTISAIVINDASQDLIDSLFKIYALFSNDNTDFFPERKMILLFTEDKKSEKYKEGIVIAGKTETECKEINQYISDRQSYFKILSGNYLSKNITEERRISIEKALNESVLFSSGQLINLDLLIDEDTYFETHAKLKLENSIDDKTIGYNWKHTHLKIGSKLHLDDFVYGKKMFQRSGEASDFAFSIARDIFDKIEEEIKNSSKQQIVYTLIGYGFYSELLVSRTCDFVNHLFSEKDIKKEQAYCEYIIIKDEDEIKFSRYIHNLKAKEREETLEKLIIIVPISSTLTTCLKIENAFDKVKQKEDRFNVKPRFYTPVIVSTDIEASDLTEYFKDESHIKESHKESFKAVKSVWNGINNELKIITTANREKEREPRENKYNIYIKSVWQLPEDCKHCFPDEPIKERPLFVTDKVSVTPSLIFDYPKWYKSNNEPYFFFKKIDDTKLDTNLPVIDKVDWVHYTGDKNKHFNYYLHYLDVFHINKDKLNTWAQSMRNEFSEERESEILLIAPDKSENGAFIHLINREIFDDRAEIIRFDKHSDHYLNFDKFFNDKIEWAKTIYFVDNLMLSGKTFLAVDEILKVSQESDRKKWIKGVFCLINRMDYSCNDTIFNKLKENNKQNKNNSSKIDNFYSFINLNVPESVLMPCPLCDERDKYEDLRNSVSLDCLKQYFVEKEIPYFKEVTKEYLMEYKLPYFPLNKNHNSTLLKVALIHFLNKALAEPDEKKQEVKFVERLMINKLPKWAELISNGSTHNDEYLNFNEFYKDFRTYIEQQEQSNIDDTDIINEFKFKANLIKILSSQSLKKYRGIYISVFYWVLGELISATITILESNKDYLNIVKKYPILSNQKNRQKLSDFSILAKSDTVFWASDKIDSYIDTVNYLRLLIKVASSLNIAYLLHEDFLNAINILINQKVFNLLKNNILQKNICQDLKNKHN